MGIWSFRIANGKLFSVTGAGVPGASGKVSPGVSTAAPAVLARPEATASAVQHTLMQAQSNRDEKSPRYGVARSFDRRALYRPGSMAIPENACEIPEYAGQR